MKKAFITLTIGGLITVGFFFSRCTIHAYEINALTPHTEVLIPGVTMSIEVTQHHDYPQDFSMFTALLIGYGPVKISLSKEETAGDLLVITGLGISSAGIRPFLKFGRTNVNLDVTVEIGSEQFPNGLLLFSSWMTQPADEPDNTYTITLAF